MFERRFNTPPRGLIIPISISDPARSRASDTDGLIDTGASRCLINRDLVKDLKLETVEVVRLTQPGHNPILHLPVVDCKVLVGNVGPISVTAIVYNVDYFYLGMNWYNEVDSRYARHNGGRILQIDRL